MKPTINVHSQKGVSLLYVMAALIVGGFIGTALLKMSHHSQMASVMYAGSESARSAVNAGFMKGLSVLEATNDVEKERVIDIIKMWVEAKQSDTIQDRFRWLTDSGNSDKFVDLGSRQKYRVQIIGIDYEDNGSNPKVRVALQSEGIGSGNSRASAIGTYALNGLGKDIPEGTKPKNAIHLETGSFEWNCSLHVIGNSYFGGSLQSNVYPPRFEGEIYVRSNNDSVNFNSGGTFEQKAYFGGPVSIAGEGEPDFQSSAGFENYLTASMGKPNISGDLFLNADVFFNNASGMNLNSGDCYYYSGANFKWSNFPWRAVNEVVQNYGSLKSSSRKMDIPTMMGFSSAVGNPVHFDVSKIPNKKIHKVISGQVHSNNLNAWYNNPKTPKWHGFMVLKVISGYNSSMRLIIKGEDEFEGKVIWLMDRHNLDLSNFYESSDDALSVLYIDKTKHKGTNWGGFDDFRGFVYVNSGELITVAAETHIQGALYQRAGTHQQFNASKAIKIKNANTWHPDTTFPDEDERTLVLEWDQSVIDELAATGIFHKDPAGETKITDGIFVEAAKLESITLSRSY